MKLLIHYNQKVSVSKLYQIYDNNRRIEQLLYRPTHELDLIKIEFTLGLFADVRIKI